MNYLNRNWEPVTFLSDVDFPANYSIKDTKPVSLNDMWQYAAKLSSDFKFVRVDFYEINGQCYFGELTFIPAAAYIQYTNDNADFELGTLLKLQ